MRPGETIKNQIIYLSYVLEGLAESADAEVLRPVLDNLRRLPVGELPRDVVRLARRTEVQMSRWVEMGMLVSRESLERVLGALKDLHGLLAAPPVSTM